MRVGKRAALRSEEWVRLDGSDRSAAGPSRDAQIGDWRNDTLTGRELYGLDGNDRLTGMAAADRLEGGNGVDVLSGGAGDDTLWGGAGTDYLAGGAGADTFVFVRGELGVPPADPFDVYEYDDVSDFDPATDTLLFYGYAPGDYQLVSFGDGTIVRFADGGQIRLERVTPDQLRAHPGALRFEGGAGPTALQPEHIAPVVLDHDIVVAAGTTQRFDDGLGYALLAPDGRPGSLTNYGTILVTTSAPNSLAAIGVGFFYEINDPAITVVNAATGLIRALNAGLAESYGLYLGDVDAPDTFNAGVVEALNTVGDATGVFAFGSWTFDNSGRITARSAQLATGVHIEVNTFPQYRAQDFIASSGTIEATGKQAVGIEVEQHTDIVNGGTILATGEAFAIGIVQQFNGSVDNSGTIRAVTSDFGAISIGIYAFSVATPLANGAGVQVYRNSGLIEADLAIYVADYDANRGEVQRSTEHVVNTGEIRGAVVLGAGEDEVVSTGTIRGIVDLGAGADLLDASGGKLFGEVFGGEGNDRLIGGDTDDVLHGDFGADALAGGAGDDWIEGGRGNDAIDGGAGFDTVSYLASTIQVAVSLAMGRAIADGTDVLRGIESVVGSAYADAITGSDGADVLSGNAGRDTLSGGKGDDTLFGDSGADRLTGGAGADAFVFSAGDGTDTVADFHHAEGDTLRIFGYSGYTGLRQVGHDTRVLLGGGDAIVLRGVDAASLTAADFVFDAQPLAPAPVARPLGTVVLEGIMDVARGERVTVEPSATVFSGPPAGFLLSGDGAQPAVFNSGTVTVAASGADAVFGVREATSDLETPEAFVNRASGVFGVVADDAASATGARVSLIFNLGRVEVSAGGGDATGLADFDGSVVNAGSLGVTAGGTAIGVDLGDLAFFWNTGSIAVHGAAASIGVRADQLGYFQSGGFVNSGTIVVTDDTAALDSVGLSFGASLGSRFFNAGLIAGDYALVEREIVSAPQASVVVNTGELRGLVALGWGMTTLFNDGLITGHVDLGAGADVFEGRLGNARDGVSGGAGDDRIFGGANADVLSGDDGNDVLAGGGGADTMSGGAGKDIFYVGVGADVIADFAPGTDKVRTAFVGWRELVQTADGTRVVFSDTDSVLLKGITRAQVSAAWFEFGAALPADTPGRPTAPDVPATPTIADSPPVAPLIRTGTAGADRLSGAALDDTLRGADGDDTLAGGDGRDRLFGGNGSDLLDGGSGDDRLEGGAGNDRLIAGGGDELVGGTGADTFEFDVSAPLGARVFDYDWLGEGDRVVLRGVYAQWNYDATTGLLRFGSDEAIYFGRQPIVPPIAVTAYATEAADEIVMPAGATIYGLGGDDTLSVASPTLYEPPFYDCVLDGGAGNDLLIASWGDDTLVGGAGSDALYGGDGVDRAVFAGVRSAYTVTTSGETTRVVGADGTDTLTATEYLVFDDGTYTIAGQKVADAVVGTGRADTIAGTTGADTIFAGSGDDTVAVRGDDLVYAGYGDDVVTLGVGVAKVFAGGGDDRVIAGAARVGSQVDGENGDDTFDASAQVGAQSFVGNAAGDLVWAGVTLRSVEIVVAGAGNDLIDLTTVQLAQAAYGGAGDDVLIGTAPSDFLDLQVQLHGGTGNDTLSATGTNYLLGEDGDDRLILTGGAASATIDGGAGRDTLIVRTTASHVDLSEPFESFEGQSFTLTGVEDVVIDSVGAGQHIVLGGIGDNVFSVAGTAAAGTTVVFEGWEGNDTLTGGAGADTLRGIFGDDVLEGGAGDDRLDGGSGVDTVAYTHSGVGVTVSLRVAGAQNTGGAGTDTLVGVENLSGTIAADRLTGDAGANRLSGKAGDDVLVGGGGADALVGGTGNDAFVFTAAPKAGVVTQILDMNVASDDTVQLAAAAFAGLAPGALAAGAFRLGTAALDADDRILYDQATGAVFFDHDGSGGTYSAIQFAGVTHGTVLTAADFLVI